MSDETIRFVEDFLRKAGVSKARSSKKFQLNLERQFGQLGINIIEAMDKRADGMECREIYAIKNKSLELSLAVSSQMAGEFYRAYMVWFLRSGLQQSSKILDIGCDQGLLTCFYASFNPDAEVIGIEREPDAVECARELAKRMNLQNVRFETMDLQTIDGKFQEASFDLITATMVFKDALGIPEIATSFSAREVKIPPCDVWSQTFASVKRILKSESAHFISVERLTIVGELAWGAKALSNAGLTVDWDQSFMLKYDEERNCSARIPIMVSDLSRPPRVSTLDDVLGFCAYEDFSNLGEKGIFKDIVAELLMEAFQPSSLIWGAEVTHSEGGVVSRTEIWEKGVVILVYGTTTKGSRQLAIYSKNVLGEIRQKIEGDIRENESAAGVRFYESMGQRNLAEQVRA